MDEGTAVSADEVREELSRILSSEGFASAARARRFLSYVVEETLNGRGDEIKELVLGVEVFDRPPDFDPRVDTIVRVEAGKLRKRLEAYYESDSASGGVRIEVPKGSYVPQFGRLPQKAAEPGPAPPRSTRRWPYVAGLVAAGLLLALALWRGQTPQASAPSSIAVLPFLNLSPDPANEYFAQGLSEELTDALAGLGNLRVASRTSAFSFKGQQLDVRNIGTKLQVAAVVEGSVRKDGDRVRITAQLVRTDDGYHLWSQSFDRDLKDILAIQEEIATAVAKTLQVKLIETESNRLKGRTASVQAFDLYLKGKSYANPQTTAEAEHYFQEAIAADPSFSKAYAALAAAYLAGDFGGVRPTVESIAKAKAALDRAVALDDQDAETHVVMGQLAARFEFDWEAGERHLRRALELDPNLATAHYQLAQNILVPQSRLEEATVEQDRTVKLDPFDSVIAAGGPWIRYLQGDYEGALKSFSTASDSRNWLSLMGKGWVLTQMGRLDEALAVFEESKKGFQAPYNLGLTGYALARKGDVAGAHKMLDELNALSKTHYASPAAFAWIHIALNEPDKAFADLERGRIEHDSPLIHLRVDPIYAPIRNDARFEKLLEEIGLSDKQIQERQARVASNYR
jgi:TolB-like protein